MPIPLNASRAKSYRQILEGTCPAEGKIIEATVDLRHNFAEINDDFKQIESTCKNMRELLSLPVPPPSEGMEVDESLNEKREELKVSIGPVEQAAKTHLQEVAELEDSFDNASRQSLFYRRNHTDELHDEVERIMARTPAVKNLSAETVKEIKDIFLKSPVDIEKIKAAGEKLDPNNTAGLKDVVNAIATELDTVNKDLSQRRVKISDSDMTLFAKTKQEVQTLEREVSHMQSNLKEFAKTLEVVSRVDPRAQKGAQALVENLNKPAKTVRERIRPAPAA